MNQNNSQSNYLQNMNLKNINLEYLDQNNSLLLLTLNRPKYLNALNFDLLTELDDILNNLINSINNNNNNNNNNNKIRGLIITGAEKAFCAGADINQLAELNTTTGYKFAKFGQSVFSKLENLAIPSIAAVNGYAFGGGCELAMSTSIRVGAEKAQFGQPEVKLGVIPGYGGTQRLARLIGKGRAIDLCLSGRFIDAKTALDWGLLTYLTPNDTNLINFCTDLLANISKMAPLALESTLKSIHHGFELSMAEALELEAVHFAKTCGTNDKKIGVDAFLNKQQADFNGN